MESDGKPGNDEGTMTEELEELKEELELQDQVYFFGYNYGPVSDSSLKIKYLIAVAKIETQILLQRVRPL